MKYFDLEFCGARENHLVLIFDYILEFVVVIWIIIRSFFEYRKNTDNKIFKSKLVILTVGIISFLLPYLIFSAFATIFVYAGKNDNYELEPYGILGFHVFIAAITYLMVKYRFFNIKLHEGQALIIGLVILVASQLFYIKGLDNIIFIAITTFITLIFCFALIRYIKGEEKIKRQHLQKLNQELLTLDQSKSEFINIASHQLRTPLTVIKGVTSLIRSGQIETLTLEEKERFYDSIWKKSQKMEGIIKDIVNAASLTNKKYLIPKNIAKPVNFEELLLGVIRDFEVESRERGIPLKLKKEPGNYIVRGVKEDLTEALNNLINNAFKYTLSEKDRPGQISIALLKHEKTIHLAIRDKGIGIPSSEIPKLFHKFFRATNARSVYTDGSGLGLFITKEIIEGHGGKIDIESELGKGTMILIQLPEGG